MASIRKRGDRWQVQIRREGIPPISRTFTLKTDAERWSRQKEAEADRNGAVNDPRQLRRVTLASLVERYRDTVVPAKRGREIETTILNAFLRHRIARHRVGDLQPAIFSAYRDERLIQVKPVTLRRELGILHHMFEVARHEWGLSIVPNPLDGFSRGLHGDARKRRLGNADEAAALDLAVGLCRNPWIKPLFEFAVATGMRRGELVRVKWGDIEFEKRTLHIPVTKNGHARTIPLSSSALGILRSLPRDVSGLVFPVSVNAVKLAWQRLTKRAGIDDLHFHDLRHEAISRFFEKGLSVPEVALISGHRDARMLFRYTHLKAEDVAAKLD